MGPSRLEEGSNDRQRDDVVGWAEVSHPLSRRDAEPSSGRRHANFPTANYCPMMKEAWQHRSRHTNEGTHRWQK